MHKKIKLVIGFITYGKFTAKYLPYFLPSLTADIADYTADSADYSDDFKIIAFDNHADEDNVNIKYIRDNYPDIEIIRAGENIGYGRAYNRMIKRAKELGAEYFLALNADMILGKRAIAKMVVALDNDSRLGSVCPKILQWDFENNIKTNNIDSCGIKMLGGLRFVNYREGELDGGSFNEKNIIGPAGTSAMYRMESLDKIREGEDYFDELMFMYKEDCDLAYRLFLAGFRSRCVSQSIMYHDRTAGGKGEGNMDIALNRLNKSRQVKKWSFLNQHIIFIKYWGLQNLKNKSAIIWHGFKMLIFSLIFEQYLLKEYFNLWKLRKRIKTYKKL